MFVELHILQNFAPSNLNRDDTGSPKDCEFGGVRRARISSQCLKRSIRTAFRDEKLLPASHLAARTKLALDAIAARLVEREYGEADARSVAELALRGAGLNLDDGKTEYLLFLGQDEIEGIAGLCSQHWTTLQSLTTRSSATTEPSNAKQAKQAGKDALPKELTQAISQRLNGSKAADLALFGRMLADLPEQNVEAASQVAHAISTHKVSVEFDFFTAVDDLQNHGETGAGMMGTVEFNSACFYRYANVDVAQLRKNLGSDDALVQRTLEAFIRASIAAIPTGKQNSMAAQNPPSLVMAVVRERGLWSLANAFARPVRATEREDLISGSIAALDAQWGKLARMYGEMGIHGAWLVEEEQASLPHLATKRVASVDTLVSRVLTGVFAGAVA